MNHHQQLTDQRIRYMIEHGFYPIDEPATKNFVLKWIVALALISVAGDCGVVFYNWLHGVT